MLPENILALLSVPGAGVGPYRGLADIAGRGVIPQIGIHGIPGYSLAAGRWTIAPPRAGSAAIRRSASIPANATTTAASTLARCAPTISSVVAAVGRAEPGRHRAAARAARCQS